MKRLKIGYRLGVWLALLLLLAACTATTANEPAVESTAVLPEETAPALTSVTSTPTASPAATALATSDSSTDNANNANNSNDPAPGKEEADLEVGDAVLVFQRTGGLMGIRSNDQTWHFYADGRVTVSDGRSWETDPEAVNALVDNILGLGFADFAASYMPEDTCCDRFTYTLIVQDGEKVYKATTMDDANAPTELFQAIDLINEFILSLPT